MQQPAQNDTFHTGHNDRIVLNYHYLAPELESTCFVVQKHSGNTRMQSSPWKITITHHQIFIRIMILK